MYFLSFIRVGLSLRMTLSSASFNQKMFYHEINFTLEWLYKFEALFIITFFNTLAVIFLSSNYFLSCRRSFCVSYNDFLPFHLLSWKKMSVLSFPLKRFFMCRVHSEFSLSLFFVSWRFFDDSFFSMFSIFLVTYWLPFIIIIYDF